LVLVALGIGYLCGFYFIFSGVARSAILLSGRDLLKLQKALGLHERGRYVKGESIYPETGDWLPQKYVASLRALNVVICLLAILFLMLPR
jgi:hypothetical protein